MHPSAPNKVTHLYDYFSILNKWSSVFTKDEITARIYKRSRFVNRSILSDFISVVKLPSLEYKIIDIIQTNSSYSHLAVSVLSN